MNSPIVQRAVAPHSAVRPLVNLKLLQIVSATPPPRDCRAYFQPNDKTTNTDNPLNVVGKVIEALVVQKTATANLEIVQRKQTAEIMQLKEELARKDMKLRAARGDIMDLKVRLKEANEDKLVLKNQLVEAEVEIQSTRAELEALANEMLALGNLIYPYPENDQEAAGEKFDEEEEQIAANTAVPPVDNVQSKVEEEENQESEEEEDVTHDFEPIDIRFLTELTRQLELHKESKQNSK